MPNFDLSRWQSDYETAPAERDASVATEVPDGTHQAQICRVELKESKTNANPMLEFELDLLGNYAGRKLWKRCMLTNPDNIKYLKADLYTCGVKIPNINDLNDEGVLAMLIGVTLEITKKTKGEFSNVYFNKRITLSPSKGSGLVSRPRAGHPSGVEDDSVPF